jgi:hypothetical protein
MISQCQRLNSKNSCKLIKFIDIKRLLLKAVTVAVILKYWRVEMMMISLKMQMKKKYQSRIMRKRARKKMKRERKRNTKRVVHLTTIDNLLN